MKKIIALLLVGFVGTAVAEAETKKVCRVDEKTKKEVCKTIKVHKKFEGTKIEDAKKK